MITLRVWPALYATIGRAADNDVVLDDPTVSNHHARCPGRARRW